MDDYHETLGRIAGYIHASGGSLKGGLRFSDNNETYKGYKIHRNNTFIDIVSPADSEYIEVKLNVYLSRQFRDAVEDVDLATLRMDYPDEVTQGMTEEDLIDFHLRKHLPDTSDESTQTTQDEMQKLIDDPDVRLNWLTYEDTDKLDGFILYTHLFPESLSIKAYDSAVNLISHFGTRLDDELFDAFGSFIQEAQSDEGEQPTGTSGDRDGPSGRSFA